VAKKKVYAVRKGRKTGLFNTWDECKEQISGFSGAEYKSFSTQDEAIEYLGLNKDKNMDNEDQKKCEHMISYVDGSYEDSLKKYGSGVVILYKNDKITFSIPGNDPKFLSMRNVSGEIKAAQKAMEYAIENNIDKLAIYHDYEGIEKWCTGVWKANKEGTKLYRDFYNSISKKLNIEFVKVKAHSGDKYNEEADKLAKEALLK
jgi:ribonuclease H-related protein